MNSYNLWVDDSNSTRNSMNLNRSKSKSSSRKKIPTPSGSRKELNGKIHEKNSKETLNNEAKRISKSEVNNKN